MKIEQLLVQHFYNTKKVTLQGMGTFTLSPDFVIPMENDKEAVIPENAISFQYEPKADEDDALITFIVQQTRKIKPLASADLDSYLTLGKQFLNIGKPFKIEGMGLLVKNQQGEYEFSQSYSLNSRFEAVAAAVKDKPENEEISFSSDTKTKASGNKVIKIAALFIGIGMAGFGAWYFFKPAKTNKEKAINILPVKPDTLAAETIKPDSVSLKPDSINTIIITPKSGDDYTFKVVFKVTRNMQSAIARMNVLTIRGHKIIMYTKDSVYYKLAEPFTLPLSDTTRIKDSLNSFYYLGSAFIELK